MQYRLGTDSSLNIQQCENLWLEIETKNSEIILVVIYRHPSKEILPFQDKLCEIFSDLNTQKLNYIIGGDISNKHKLLK